ncbi:MAG: hypothetical protein E6J90_26550 [Deltaproteobacteria bacterium]|nr:MAG: hypothetical protein E6J90_26550 [Deltaproteobacteria bacterium]
MVAAIAGSGCVDGFKGSNIQIDLSPATPAQAPIGMAPGPGELPQPIHFSIYAIQEDPVQNRLFEVTRFEVHHIVDKTSPCFIDVGEHVTYPGLHVTSFLPRVEQDTGIADPSNPPPGATDLQKELVASAIARRDTIDKLLTPFNPRDSTAPAGLVAVTSASPARYPAVASDCNGPADQIPPPACMDDASNKRRLALCQATWKANPDLWEGTDRVLTAPLNGTTHGMTLVPRNAVSGTPVGGAQFFVDNALGNIDAYAIYFQADGMDTPGTQLYFGRPAMPTRGVLHVHMTSPLNPALTAEMAVFTDLGQDDVHF